MKCAVCGQAELRWVKGKRFVFCPACGTQIPNFDGKIKVNVPGRPKDLEASTSQATKPSDNAGAGGKHE